MGVCVSINVEMMKSGVTDKSSLASITGSDLVGKSIFNHCFSTNGPVTGESQQAAKAVS